MIHGCIIAALLGLAVIVAIVRRSRSARPDCAWQEWCESSRQWEPMRDCPPDKTVRIRRTGKAKKK